MKNFYDLVKMVKIPKNDKLMHHYIGSIISLLTLLFLLFLVKILGMNYYLLFITPIPSIILGIYKEYVDWKTKKGNPEMLDFLFTIKEGMTYLLIIILIK